ncbi:MULTISPECIES: hypothetical protein [unclassified Chelatococcus]|uniref:hypothetical protein n=1 Tax=unclassified Chelatococcus TaxID=2638111 RepID=UPI001BCD98B7|nr:MULTISPECIES: hypothetical protein [unclassified Chelatococcus]MBS7698231.1 hypothetical protein [Chelatococcus sp. YT9]MBX3559838.1 hypothetical protein [Chelatococcus sp.]
MVSRLVVIALTCCLTGLPAMAAPCIGPEALPGVSAAPRSVGDASKSKSAAARADARKTRPSRNCDAGLAGGAPQASGVVTRKGNALTFGDTEIRINGRVRVEGAYGR